MKIIFICGSAEPGNDGVGDYTRRLAGTLIGKGHLVFIIALNDQAINISVQEKQPMDDQMVSVLRLASKDSYKNRLDKAKAYIDTINPDWLSLQYVPFSFHKKGVTFNLGYDLTKIGGDRKWHIMLHELWCGMNVKAPFKEKILGLLQKLALKKIIQDLKPVSIFTSLLSYKRYLSQLNINPIIVPIFGNIPISTKDLDLQYVDFINELGIVKKDADTNYIKLGFFGSIYHSEGLEDLILQFYNYAVFNNKIILLLIIGDGRGLDIKNIINFDKILYKTTGRLPEELLDQVLKTVDVGIMTSTADGLDKSGSAIAFLERGIPVVVAGTDKSYEDTMKWKGLYQINQLQDAAFVLEKGKYFTSINRLENAVSMYLNTL
jgi:hypothetical protein